MWGTGTKDEETIPSFVAQMLHESGASAQVFNFGESGWVSTQEMIELQKLLQQGARPDIVVFYDGVNDTFSAYQNRAAGLPQNERNREIEFNLTHPYRPLTEVLRVASSAMLSHSRLAQLTGADGAAPVLLPPISYPHRISSTPAEDAVRTYHTNLRIVSAPGREFDFAPYFYWQPVVFAKSHQTEYEQLMAGQREALKPFSNDVYSHIVALQTPVANFHNLGELFQDVKEPIFLDYAHIGAEGNRRIAAAMVKDLLPALKAK